MIRHASMLLAIVTLLSMGIVSADESWVIRDDGVGPVKIGMTLPQLNTVLHEEFSMPKAKDEQGCFYVTPSKHDHVLFMIENGHLARVDVDAPGISTVEGVQVGDSEEHARRVYGSRLRVQPHAYIPENGHFLTVRSKDGRYGIRFETEDGKIQMFYAGQFKAVQYIEGCE